MEKSYPTMEEQPEMLADQAVTYGRQISQTTPLAGISAEEAVLSSTMSVDEYFDELIEKVRHDYAAL